MSSTISANTKKEHVVDAMVSNSDLFSSGGGGYYEFESGGVVMTRDPKPMLRWTVDLHERFVDAVTKLGGPDYWKKMKNFSIKWVALENLPTLDRLKKGMRLGFTGIGTIDVGNLGLKDMEHILDRLLKVLEEDNENFLLKLRDKIDRFLLKDVKVIRTKCRCELNLVGGGILFIMVKPFRWFDFFVKKLRVHRNNSKKIRSTVMG